LGKTLGKREYELDELAYKILALAGEGHPQAGIRRILNLDRVLIHNRIQTLKKYGYIIIQKEIGMNRLILTAKGVSSLSTHIISQGRVGIGEALTSAKFKISQRPHDIQVKLKLVNALSLERARELFLTRKIKYEEVKMHNHIDFSLKGWHKEIKKRNKPKEVMFYNFSQNIRQYKENIVITIPSVEADMMEEELSKAMESIYDKIAIAVKEYELRTGIHTKRLDKDTIIATLVNQHIALKDHPLASILRLLREKGILPSFEVADPDGGQPLLIIDFSHGHDELETLNIENGENIIEGFKELTLSMAKGEFKAKKVLEELNSGTTQLEQIKEIILGQAEVNKQTAEALKGATQAIQALSQQAQLIHTEVLSLRQEPRKPKRWEWT
jgi:predicted transcriptional regulator